MASQNESPDSTRYDIAAKILDGIFTPAWREKQKKTGFKASDDFAQICVEHCYTDAWARDTLDFKTRSVICLSSLATMGAMDELKLHVEAALANGHTHEDIIEILVHLIPYIGVPKSVQALRAAGDAFKELFARDQAAKQAG
jgi:alkylhydroperoxidase/carboxymuconolactone decarboxylase family protein YurZ